MKNDKRLSWNDISIEKYYQIKDAFDDTASDLEKNIKAVSIILEIPEDEIWNLPMPEAEALFKKIKFIDKFELINIKDSTKSITIEGTKFNLLKSLNKMTVAQYTDYQTFVSYPLRESIDKILSVFLIPDGHQYNEGYDIIEVQKMFREKMSFLLAQSLLNFLLAKCLLSMKDSLRYLVKEIRNQKNLKKRMEAEKLLEQSRKTLRQIFSLPGCAYSRK